MHVYFFVFSFGDILLWPSWQNETVWAESTRHLGFQLSAFTFCLFSHFFRCSAFKAVQRWLGTNPISASNICKSALCECGSSEKWGSPVVKDMYTGSADLCSLQATVIAVIPEKEECLGTTFLSSFQDKLGCHQLSKFLRYFSHLGSITLKEQNGKGKYK